jgi:transcription factor 1
MKPSLEKHVGCDIIDLNPGPGIWSSAIHDFLKPRTHVLMEPDDALYRPLLQPLLDAEGSTYKLIPKSGVVWAFLQQALSPELLPHQKVREPGDPRLEEQNDTLLVLANLGYYPKKPYRGFSSISSLVIYQLLSAARSHSLFHKYGLIRMLIWVEDEEKKMVLPRSIVNRRKSSVEAEVTCGDIFEVASSTDAVGVSLRDHNLDLESSMAVLKRMDEAGIKTPKNRQGALEMEATKSSSRDISAESQIVKREFYKELEDLERRFDAEEFSMFQDSPEGRQALETFQSLQTSARSPKLQTPEWTRMALLTKAETRWKKEAPKSTFKHEDELRELRERFAAGEFQQYQLSEDGLPKRVNKTSMAKYYTPEYKRLEYLRTRSRMENKRVARAMALSDEYDEILTMQKEILSKDGSEADSLRQEIDRRTEEWKEEMQLMNNEDDRALVYNMLDNRSAFHRDPPVLYWDRRKAEPLKTDPQEFFPKAEMALLDFQPQPLWPVLRENFPANYDVFEYIVSNLLMIPTQSIRQGLSSLAPGAFEWLVQECPSISDPNKGGNPDHDFMRVRTLTLEMYKEMTEAWLRWPFRPSRYDLLSLMGSEVHDPDAAEVGERV